MYWLRKKIFFSYLSTKNGLCILGAYAKRRKNMTSCPVLVNYGTEFKINKIIYFYPRQDGLSKKSIPRYTLPI